MRHNKSKWIIFAMAIGIFASNLAMANPPPNIDGYEEHNSMDLFRVMNSDTIKVHADDKGTGADHLFHPKIGEFILVQSCGSADTLGKFTICDEPFENTFFAPWDALRVTLDLKPANIPMGVAEFQRMFPHFTFKTGAFHQFMNIYHDAVVARIEHRFAMALHRLHDNNKEVTFLSTSGMRPGSITVDLVNDKYPRGYYTALMFDADEQRWTVSA